MTKAQMQYKLQRLEIMGPWYGRAFCIAASAIPVAVFMLLLEPFAGKDTNLNVSVVASLSLTANLVMGGALWRTRRSMNEQSAELNRLRGRVETYEPNAGSVSSAQRGAHRRS